MSKSSNPRMVLDHFPHTIISWIRCSVDTLFVKTRQRPWQSLISATGVTVAARKEMRTNATEKVNSDKRIQGKLGPHDFELLACVGQGSFGKVFQCRKTGTDHIFAMKVIPKIEIMFEANCAALKAERDILTKVDHPFIVKLHYSFQTRTHLYLILDFINGGDLSFQLSEQVMFGEELARIYTAEIACAVAYLHKLGIIHRDLKPENILLDAEGHVKIIDFGLAKEVYDLSKSNNICGTLYYMAPEVILEKGQGKSADWWSVGILLYEMLTGKPPFDDKNRYRLQRKIKTEKIQFPASLTSDAIRLLKGLLEKDPRNRLGSGKHGFDDIKNHEWFKEINWEKVLARELEPKFRPTVLGIHCISNFDEILTKMPLQDFATSTAKIEHVNVLRGYTYIAADDFPPCPGKSFELFHRNYKPDVVSTYN